MLSYSNEDYTVNKVIFTYQGIANIYLEGDKALEPVNNSEEDFMEYYLGTRASKIRILDYRVRPMKEAKKVLDGNYNMQFAESFNQPSLIQVSCYGDSTEIIIENEFDENIKLEDCLTLWMGVITDNTMAIFDTYWEIFKPIGINNTSFVSLTY